MKIRNGFVSNSSSASYIIGIGRVSDIKGLLSALDHRPFSISNSDIGIVLTDGKYYEGYAKDVVQLNTLVLGKGKPYYSVEAFNDDKVVCSITDGYDPIVGFYCYRDESGNLQDEDGDVDYSLYDPPNDILDFFRMLTDSNYVIDFNYTYGAGRNG